ncbi:hypothetical protein NJ7G_4080 [Natrinema sp. J7-2]|nr:hypothetical protein NJ7G_4080 [Natrinema sp. J7-2]
MSNDPADRTDSTTGPSRAATDSKLVLERPDRLATACNDRGVRDGTSLPLWLGSATAGLPHETS